MSAPNASAVTDSHPVSLDYLSAYLNKAWQADLDEGMRAWVQAFQQALDHWQHDDCRRLLGQIKAAPHFSAVESLVRYVEGLWAMQQGDFKRALHNYQVSLSLNRNAGYQWRVAEVLDIMALTHQSLGRLDEAAEHFQSALEIFRALDETEDIVGTLGHLAAVYTEQGEWAKAGACFDEGFELADAPEMRAFLLTNQGAWYHARGQSQSAEQCYATALRIYRESDDLSGSASLLNNLGLLALERRELAGARAHLTEALSFTQTLGNWIGTIHALGNLALVAEAEGDLKDAIEYCSEAIASAEALGDLRAVGTFLNLRGTMYIEMRQFQAATTDLERSLELSRQVNHPQVQAEILNNLGNAYRHLEQLDKAQVCYQEALALAKQLGDLNQIGGVLSSLGHLHALDNDKAQAKARYQQAITIAKQTEDRVLESVGVLGLCTLAWEQQDIELLASLLDEAWDLGEATRQPDVLVRVSWMRGDIAALAYEQDTCFSAYARAVILATKAGDHMVDATLERIEIYLDYLQPQAAGAACKKLRTAWNEVELLQSRLDLAQWLHTMCPGTEIQTETSVWRETLCPHLL